ncbi:transcription initiation factor TFIID subunit 9 [Phakopsora pachyrhizi]|uniref:Transcription initiation factor TFIID subunit 9 n=1 Tax=Phakopsora pachyrhizi TaxID=170000 RepID=A0AAV0B2Y5_PHAPC|nr:transcription initiation factor TFIID subunit 9 [Phakopsora pachyrhizi]CAH7675252.1 transcription initiation factor TFIID subunit 9 [Phakopsora pachyrhizi]
MTNRTSVVDVEPPNNSEPQIRQLPTPTTPRDARIIALLLASMGVQSSSEGVVRVLMEFAHRYTSDILSDAIVYAEHAGRAHAAHGPNVEDVRLAVQAKVEHSMSGPMSKEFLLSLAENLNKTTLPPIPERYGIRLPPEKDRLTAPNFDICPKPPTTTVETPTEQGYDGMFGGIDDDDSESESENDTELELSPVITVNGNTNGAGDHGKRRLEEMEDNDYD